MEEEKNIINNGGYQDEDVIWHQHSNLLMLKMLELWTDKNRSIIDIGCGHNFYASIFENFGYKAWGCDQKKLKGVDIIDVDLTKKIQNQIKNIDEFLNEANVISLEVGEHIPYELCSVYLDNLCSFKGDIILSWAVPGQAGIGHINCQPNEWVQKQMYHRGYLFHHSNTLELREAVKNCHCNWFVNTLMYFKPIKK